MARDTDPDFQPSDLIGTSGVGSNGALLVNSLLDFYPEDLQAAQLRRINPDLDDKLSKDEDGLKKVARIAGVDKVAAVHVRGGERDARDAWVSYVCVNDETGTHWKGAFPYNDLASGKSDRHVSQRDAMAQSDLAAQHRAGLPAQTQAVGAQAQSDPFEALKAASADDLVAQMREHPDRVETIKAFERASRGDKARKTVTDFESESSEEDDSGNAETPGS